MADLNTAFQGLHENISFGGQKENRLGSDECNQERKKMENAKPLKYMTTNFATRGGVAPTEGGSSMLGASSLQYTSEVSKRPELTNQRFIHQLQPSMYMTAPYEGNGEFIGEESGEQVKKSSMLRPESDRVGISCNVAGAEIDRFDALSDVTGQIQSAEHVVEDPEFMTRGGSSTRNDFKNMFNNC